MICTGAWRKPIVNRLEQLFAVIITTGLVMGNFLLFTPWRDGQDPRIRRESWHQDQPLQRRQP